MDSQPNSFQGDAGVRAFHMVWFRVTDVSVGTPTSRIKVACYPIQVVNFWWAVSHFTFIPRDINDLEIRDKLFFAFKFFFFSKVLFLNNHTSPQINLIPKLRDKTAYHSVNCRKDFLTLPVGTFLFSQPPLNNFPLIKCNKVASNLFRTKFDY